MHWLLWTILIIIAIVVIVITVWVTAALIAGSPGDRWFEVVRRTVAIYCKLVHRVTIDGCEHIPPGNSPIIVVSNHTAGIDPLLIQTAVRRPVRWMMAADYMTGVFKRVFEWRKLIAVARDGSDSGPAREAIRHVKAGGSIGIFPEGGLARPPGEVRPFLPGVGLIIARAKAPVLLTWVRDTPEIDSAFGSLTKPSRSRVTFIDCIEFDDDASPAEITSTLRARLAAASNWPLNEEIVPTARREVRNGEE
ncbi:MAG: lysophospholipid acyltransferase family protein [Phycisphaerales bacterium]